MLMLLMSHSFWWSFQDTCCLTFQTSTMQKPRVFAAFQTKTSQLTPKLHNHKTRKAWYLRHFRQNATKTQEQKTWENENPETSSCSRKPRKTQGFPVFFLKYLPNINDAPRAAADARATLLLLLLLYLPCVFPSTPDGSRSRAGGIWDFPKRGGGGTLFWGPYNKDPTIWGTILGPPIFGKPRIGGWWKNVSPFW